MLLKPVQIHVSVPADEGHCDLIVNSANETLEGPFLTQLQRLVGLTGRSLRGCIRSRLFPYFPIGLCPSAASHYARHGSVSFVSRCRVREWGCVLPG